MLLRINILAQIAADDLTPLQTGAVNMFILVLTMSAITLLVYWLSQTRFGTDALIDSRPRRNSMSFYMPIIPFMTWMAMGVLFGAILHGLPKNISDYHIEILQLLATLAIYVIILSICVFIIKTNFVRAFKGLGLRLRTIKKDIPMAALRLFMVYPVVGLVMLLIIGIGRLFLGPDWTITPHESLQLLDKYPELFSRMLLVFVAVIMAPLVEEILFRGLFQTMLRNFMPGPWAAIFATSLIFAMAHPDPVHIPILFTLSVGLGYAYDKSGSLLQSMIMHAMFNATSVIGTLFFSQKF